MRDMLRIVLRRDGYDVLVAEDGRQALGVLERERVDLLLSDIRMADISGVDVLRAAKQSNRDIIAFMMTAFASTETAVEAMRLGAVDYFTKPFSMDELRLKVRQHVEASRLKQENVLLKRVLNTQLFVLEHHRAQRADARRLQDDRHHRQDQQHGADHRRIRAPARIWWPAPSTSTRMRRDQPFVALNCGAIPETLLESELFGHMRGAFTGADQNKKGLLEVADRGTIFLDEIGEMNASMQVKLLRVLQERRFRRLGGTDEVRADVRVIAATNQELPRLVAEGRFREDLFYRINVIGLQLPSLRERLEDIPLLAEHFLAKFSAQMEKPVRAISREAHERLAAYRWPGNVRELENAIERAMAVEQTPTLLPESLPPHVRPNDDGLAHERAEAVPRTFRSSRHCRKGSTSRRGARISIATTSRWPWSAPAASRPRPPSSSA